MTTTQLAPPALAERVNSPVSGAELDRRRAAVREGMADGGIDVLVAQSNNDFLGGIVRYLVDFPATFAYTMTVVLPLHDDVTLVTHGAFDDDFAVAPDDPARRGIDRVLGTPMFASVPYTRNYEAKLLTKALQPFARGRIGLAGSYQFSAAMLDWLRSELPEAEFIDASEVVDRVRMIKSAEEFEMIERTAALQDAAMDVAFKAIKPGMRDRDLVAIAQRRVQEGGGEQGLYLCASMRVGEPTIYGPPHLQNRVIQEGDFISLLLETNGPGGQYCELGRSCMLGQATDDILEEFQFVLRARQMCLEMMRPGVACAEVFERYNAFMRENGRPEERRLHCHGQGYDLVERPLIRSDEPAALAANMNVACHPGYLAAGVFSVVCDNFRINADGTTPRLHRFPEKILEL